MARSLGCDACEIRHRVAQHAINGLALFACQALIEHRKPATHGVDRRLRRTSGDNPDETDFYRRLTRCEQEFLHSLAGTNAGENDIDIEARFEPAKRIIRSARSTILIGWPILRT